MDRFEPGRESRPGLGRASSSILTSAVKAPATGFLELNGCNRLVDLLLFKDNCHSNQESQKRMTSNPQSSGHRYCVPIVCLDPLRPPVVGSAGPPLNFGASMPVQLSCEYCSTGQWFQPHNLSQLPLSNSGLSPQRMPAPNIAMPVGQTQMPHFSQSTQQLPPIPGQPGQVPPSSQAIPMSYVQASRPISSGPLPPQQNAQVPNNVPNLPSATVPLSSSYTAPNTINAPVQYQPATQVTPSRTQTWATPGTQSVPLVAPCHQQQPLATSVTVPAMRIIINDKRYSALKTLGERKQAFNESAILYLTEFVFQNVIWLLIRVVFLYSIWVKGKKQETEEKRIKQKKAREDFTRMLEECKELTSQTRWWVVFDIFIKAISIFEDDERFSAVERPREREDLFENYLVELQKKYHEEKIQIKDAMKIGKITLTLSWTFEDFKNSIADIDIQKGVSEISLKELFLFESCILSALFYMQYLSSSGEAMLYSANTWFFFSFQNLVCYASGSSRAKLIYDELLERLREKEEKEAKKRQRLADYFSDLLYSIEEITASSKWEECISLIEESQNYRSICDDNFAKEIFEGYIAHLQEKMKEKERREEEKVIKFLFFIT
ncbi:hypothetical protein ZIOFF_075682 [Zingiber officinale]|uniref:FF domain-containing protein n=1 Tax=Zingiber officinale TaxID=94328 RepID=A0A8J5BWU7_ZINOF|nr:hypothetical protein ZIOFF_075682 [Zingiber officinale]